jgi:hypothetical protein
MVPVRAEEEDPGAAAAVSAGAALFERTTLLRKSWWNSPFSYKQAEMLTFLIFMLVYIR